MGKAVGPSDTFCAEGGAGQDAGAFGESGRKGLREAGSEKNDAQFFLSATKTGTIAVKRGPEYGRQAVSTGKRPSSGCKHRRGVFHVFLPDINIFFTWLDRRIIFGRKL